MSLNTTCPTCAAPSHLLCTGCNGIKYCSKECQETDWQFHRLLCKSAFTPRPLQEVRRVLFFDPNAERPDMIWVEVREDRDEDGKLLCQQPVIEELMEGKAWPAFDVIERSAFTGVELGYHIHLCYLNDAPKDIDAQLEENKAVDRVTDGLTRYAWRGPIVAFCGIPDPDASDSANLEDIDIVEVTDMDMPAYSHVVAYLVDRFNTEEAYRAMLGPKIEAVLVRCNGEVTERGRERFERVRVPRLHPFIRGDGRISEVSQAVDMPLVCITYKTDPGVDYSNPTAAALLTGLANTTAQSSLQNADDADHAGNILVFHEDFSPLDLETLQAFVAYCKTIHRQTQNASQRSVAKPTTGGGVPAQVSVEKWKAFLARWQEVKSAISVSESPSNAAAEDAGGVEGMARLRLANDGVAEHEGDGAVEEAAPSGR